LKLSEIPPRPFDDLSEFILEQQKKYGHEKNKVQYPCIECRGTGKIYRIEDLDPIEGYKMANKFPCGTCNGTGGVSKDDMKKMYDNLIDSWKLKRDLVKKQRDIEKSLIIKINKFLTKEEIMVLDEYIG
jgi:hypothetical protein